MSTSGSRFKELRLKLNLSQEEMGQIFNLTKSYISLVERDKSQLSADSFKKLFLDYKVNLNWLIAGEGDMFLSNANQFSSLKSVLRTELLDIFTEYGFIKKVP